MRPRLSDCKDDPPYMNILSDLGFFMDDPVPYESEIMLALYNCIKDLEKSFSNYNCNRKGINDKVKENSHTKM